MAEASTAMKKAQEIIGDVQGATRKKTAATTTTATVQKTVVDEKFSDINTNTFYQIVFNEKLDAMQKKEEIAKALSFDPEDKTKSQETLKEFVLFKEYLQNERKRLAQEIIKLTDTGAFSELQGVIEELNGGILEFDKQMTPLTEIIDAVYKLRLQGGETVLGVFREIKEDQAAEEDRKKKLAENERKLVELQQRSEGVNGDLAVLKNSRSSRKWFGLGGLKEEAIRNIAAKEGEIAALGGEVEATVKQVETLKDPNTARDSQYAEFAAEKAKLRELLDLTSEQHKARQKGLVNAAQDFVNKSDTRVGNVVVHLDQMTGQIEGLSNVNNGMQSIYAIVSEASKDASDENQKIRDAFLPPKEGAESPIEQMQRENKKQAAEEYITSLDASTVDTMKTYQDLTSQAIRIKQMKDANRDQVSKTRELHSSGIAGVADRLSTVLQAVSAAALNESSEAAKMSINTMNDKTNAVAMKESIRTAMGIKDAATGLAKAVDDLAAYGEVLRTSSEITREGVKEIKEGLSTLQDSIKKTKKDLQDAYAVNAEVAGGAPVATNDDKPAEKKAAAPKKAGVGADFGQFNK
ncbi:MAG TPA: hypothetical protein VEF76_12090 [Patescibacteria group bacterium]|nr:hypothetical protein [Patescibacteria group bacterium]